MKQFMALGGHLLQAGDIDSRSREIVILRVGWRSESEYEFSQHITIGRAAGVSDDEISRICDVDSREWSPDDLSLIDLADELCSLNAVSDFTWNALSRRYSNSQMIELVMLVGFYRMVCGMLNGVAVALEDGASGWPSGAPQNRRAPRS